MNHFCLVIEPTDLDALAARFPGAHRADGLFGAQGFASSLYVHDPDGNTIELQVLRGVNMSRDRRCCCKERAALCDTLEKYGPDAPTLCAGWLTLDLAAHLVAREARSDAAIGLVFPPARQAPAERDGPLQGAGLRPARRDAAHRTAVDAPHRSARDRERERELHPPRRRAAARRARGRASIDDEMDAILWRVLGLRRAHVEEGGQGRGADVAHPRRSRARRVDDGAGGDDDRPARRARRSTCRAARKRPTSRSTATPTAVAIVHAAELRRLSRDRVSRNAARAST